MTPRSAFVTTSTSGTSMIPAFRNCSASPEPGWTITATVSAASATSVSDCPTPTVSITTMSKAAASACAAARVAGARPPSRSPAAIERMKMPRSAGSLSIRARSPSSAPPERLEDGSTASTATVRPLRAPRGHERAQQRRLARARRPGHPDHVRGRLTAQRLRRHRRQQRRDLRPRGRRAVLDEIQRRRRRREVPLAQPRAEVGPAHAAVAMPFRSATNPTTSRRIRLSSKSFGV